VRPNRPADSPRAFLEALRHKYASDSDLGVETHDQASKMAYEISNRVKISGKEVEEVGFDKIKKQLSELHELRIVLLDGLCLSQPIDSKTKAAWNMGRELVSSASPLADDILRTCPRISELDLSRNLFEEWMEIAFISQNLKNLRELRLE
jgi:tubulin-specific chaperone E